MSRLRVGLCPTFAMWECCQTPNLDGNAGDHTADGQTDGRAVLRRVSLEKRQDSILQLLPLGNGDLRAARSAVEYRSSHRSLVSGAFRMRHLRLRRSAARAKASKACSLCYGGAV